LQATKGTVKMPENEIENNRPAVQEQEDSSLSDFAFGVMKGAVAAAAAGLLGVGEGVAGGARAVGAGARTRDIAGGAAEGLVIGALAGGVISGLGARMAEGAIIGAAAGAGAKVANEAMKGSTSEIKDFIKAGANEVLDIPKDLYNHMENKPIQSALEFIVFPPIVPILSSKVDKYLRK